MKTQSKFTNGSTKEETLGLQAIFVNRADIINGIRNETEYHWKK